MPTDPLLQQLLDRARNLREHAETLKTIDPEASADLAERAERHERAAEALQGRTKQRTVPSMETESRELKIGRALAGDHPFPQALHAKGMTVTEWADAQKPRLTREKVSSWYKAGKGGRRIPDKWARKILKDFGVPLASWPHGVKE